MIRLVPDADNDYGLAPELVVLGEQRPDLLETGALRDIIPAPYSTRLEMLWS
jgi:hypothetical protein